jgi:hypothetical protein
MLITRFEFVCRIVCVCVCVCVAVATGCILTEYFILRVQWAINRVRYWRYCTVLYKNRSVPFLAVQVWGYAP